MGYWLAEHYWGKGMMPQAVKLVTDYAFAHLDVMCIVAFVLSKNPASMRVMEKAGFTKQGIIQKSVIKNGEVLDEHIYCLNRD
jgi:RimJ/RimL family protein N-acetyltransferase